MNNAVNSGQIQQQHQAVNKMEQPSFEDQKAKKIMKPGDQQYFDQYRNELALVNIAKALEPF